MTSLREQLGNLEWGGSNYTTLLKDMTTSHLANCELLCARKVREFAELGVTPCEYLGAFHHEWQVLFQAQRVVTEGDFDGKCSDLNIWEADFRNKLHFVLTSIAARNMGKLKAAAQKAADEAYKQAMENAAAAHQHRHTERQAFDYSEMRGYYHGY